jgi:DNA-binding NarL/FixJ family response regulator
MKDDAILKLFLVDDDTVFLKLMEIEFQQQADFSIETYASGELCMRSISHNPDIVILDYNLNGLDKNAMNGLEVLHQIKAFNPDIQVVMLSSQDVLDVAINSMANKAIDYVVKSETAFHRIQKIITTIVNFKKMENSPMW